MLTHSVLHHTILKYVIDNGFAPDIEELCAILNQDEAAVGKALYALQDYHGVVLHPHAPKVWAIHPFCTAPTNFIVRSSQRSWWGCCAWCALGIVAVVKGDATITTNFGAHGERIDIHIHNGKVSEGDLLVHFPIPMKNAWDNVIYTCSTMLVFNTKQEINTWSAQHQIPQGDIQPLSKVWDLAQIWYGRHLDADWKKWTVQEAQMIFQKLNLTHPVWQLEDSSGRF